MRCCLPADKAADRYGSIILLILRKQLCFVTYDGLSLIEYIKM